MNLNELLDDKKPQPDHKKEISESKFLEILKSHCRNSYAVIRQAPIYLADSGKSDFLVVTPAAREVKTAFWIDRLVKEMSSWKRFPSRSKFMRGYTSAERAGDIENELYVMIPYDHARIGICPKSSFYKSFQMAQKDFGIDRLDNDGLSKWVGGLCRAIQQLDPKAKFNDDVTPDSFSEFTRLIKEIDEIISKNKDALRRKLKDNDSINDEDRKVISDLLNRHITSTQSYIQEKLDPENNGFSAIRVESFSHKPDVREVWIESPCLLVKKSKYVEMYKRGAVK